VTKPESQPESDAEATAPPATDAPPDAVKDKFREALARKQGKDAAGEAHLGGGAKVSSQHGPAKTQRTFRRKSGG
jgi:hypothetical protein